MLFKRGVHALEMRFYAFEKRVNFFGKWLHVYENNIFILSGAHAFEKGVNFS